MTGTSSSSIRACIVTGSICIVASSVTADWRFDEFRLSDRGNLVHVIEWYHLAEVAQWIIESDDVVFSWYPFNAKTNNPPTRTVR